MTRNNQPGDRAAAGPERVVILGGGALGSMARDVCAFSGREPVGFLDNFKPAGTVVCGCPVLGPMTLVETDAGLRDRYHFMVAVSDARVRREWLGRIRAAGGRLVSLIHPSVDRSPSARLGEGLLICSFVMIGPNTVVGDGCLIEPLSVLGPDVEVSPVCVIGPGVVVGAGTRVGSDSFIGAGTIIRPGVTIGEGCMVAINSSVTRPIPAFKFAAGSPARVIRSNGHRPDMTVDSPDDDAPPS